MSDKEFKIGDRVKIINASSIEPYELNKVGIISNKVGSSYVVDMGRPRREREPEETCWWLQEGMIELADQPNTQLLFNFMY